MYLSIYHIKLIKHRYTPMTKYIVNLDKTENVENKLMLEYNKLMLNVRLKSYRMRFSKTQR